MRNDDQKREWGGYLFWSSWRRQTKKEGWKRQEEELFDEAVYVCLHLLHTFSFSLSFIFSVSIPRVCSFEFWGYLRLPLPVNTSKLQSLREPVRSKT